MNPSPSSSDRNGPAKLWPLALCLHLALLLNWGGVALQSGSIYLFALIIPLVILFRRGQRLAAGLGGVALGLALLWLIFPISNMMVWGLDQVFGALAPADAHMSIQVDRGKSLMSSHTPSTVMGLAGVLAIALGFAKVWWRRFVPMGEAAAPVWSTALEGELWRRVLAGYSITILIVAAYLVVQHVTGMDLRSKTGMINPGNLMPSGFYRVHGFYGHTLSLASNALALAAFFAVLAIKLRSLDAPWKPLWRYCAWLAAVMVVLIYLAGSRSVMVMAVVMAIAMAVIFALPVLFGRGAQRAVLILCGAALMAVVAGFAVMGAQGFVAAILDGVVAIMPDGIAGRFVPLAERIREGRFEDIPRLVFWRTHWQMILDQPLFGHGYAYISDTTQLYYRQLGLGDYFRKYNAHNVYLQFVAETGVVGVAMLIATLKFLWNRLVIWAGADQFRRAWLSAFGWSLAANALHGFTQNTFFDANVAACYIALLAVVLLRGGLPPTR